MARQKASINVPGLGSLTFTLDGVEKITVPLRKYADRIDDMRPFWIEYWGPAFFANVQKNFSSQGGLVGGWRALSPAYAAWKFAHYGRQTILVRTGRMRTSFIGGARENVFKVSKKRVEAGSRDPKVKYHQAGTSRMPQRKIVVQLEARTTQRLLNRFIRDEAQAVGFKAS